MKEVKLNVIPQNIISLENVDPDKLYIFHDDNGDIEEAGFISRIQYGSEIYEDRSFHELNNANQWISKSKGYSLRGIIEVKLKNGWTVLEFDDAASAFKYLLTLGR